MSEIVRGRQHRFTVTALNIEVHPHEDEGTYDALFEKVFEMSQVIEIHGDRSALMTSYEPRKDRRFSERGYVLGTITTFINLDTTATWFNVATKKKVDDEVARRNIVIPPDYRPNTADFDFIFDPDMHIFICQERSEVAGATKKVVSLSAGLLVRYFETLFRDPQLIERFKELNVIPVPDTGRVEDIISSPTLKKLHLRIKKPNPDVLDRLRRSVNRRLQNMHADEMQEIVQAVSGEVLKPDAELANMSRIAALSGEVIAVDRDPNGKTREVSTQSIPASFDVRYHKSSELRSSVLQRAAEFAIDQIRRFKARFSKPTTQSVGGASKPTKKASGKPVKNSQKKKPGGGRKSKRR